MNKVWTHLQWPKHQERLRNCAEAARGETAVDIGCAYGHSTKIMEGFSHSGIQWTGVDFAVQAIRRARRFFPDGDWRYCADVSKLRELGQFDSVVCSEVFEHVLEDWKLANEIVRMARKRIIITTPAVRVSDPGHLRIYTEKSLLSLFAPIIRITDMVDLYTRNNFIYLIVEVK